MTEKRLECLGVVQVSWTDPSGSDHADSVVPVNQVWASGGQFHMGEHVEPGTRLQVLMDGSVFLVGNVESSLPDGEDGRFGYTVDVSVRPRKTWQSGIRNFWYSEAQPMAKAG